MALLTDKENECDNTKDYSTLMHFSALESPVQIARSVSDIEYPIPLDLCQVAVEHCLKYYLRRNCL